jgi:hypothetical protein
MIEKLPVKDVVKFRNITEKTRKTFVKNMGKPKKPKKEGEKSSGGHYWAGCLGGIDSAFKQNDNSIIEDRIARTEGYYSISEIEKTKVRHQRNIDILKDYIGFDFAKWRPIKDVKFLSQQQNKSIVDINGLPITITPSHIFSYEIDDVKYIAGIWFVVLLEGYKTSDLGIFSEAIHRCLVEHYSEEYIVKPEDCMVVDIVNGKKIDYSSVLEGKVKSLLDSTIGDISKTIE